MWVRHRIFNRFGRGAAACARLVYSFSRETLYLLLLLAIASIMLGQILRQRYKIIRLLGEGGFGKTYLAEDLDLPVNPKPKCVVKQLHPQMINPDIVRRFEKEGEILYRLGQNCDQIPDLYAYFQEDGQFYLIQEFVEGRTLEGEIGAGRQWNEAQTLTFLREVLEVLAFVHQNKVIHRDIKPANLMRRDRDRKLVLIDFGIVKEITTVVANPPGQIAQTIAIGTPGYMPSEQTIGQPRFSSDIYAVGMTAIYALTGVSPDRLPTDSQGEMVWRHLVAGVSETLAAILSKMVLYHFSYRYADATEALQALSQSATTEATLAVSPHVPLNPRANATLQPSVPSSGSRRPWLLFAGIALVASAATATIYPRLQPSSQPATTQNDRPETRSSQRDRVPAFPVDTPRSDVEAVLGQPARDLKGVYGNTRAVVYESVQSGVDLGYLFDKDSGRIRQTEASFRDFVNLSTQVQTLTDLLGGQIPAEIEQGLQQIYQHQIDNYRFNIGALKGQIVRQDCGDIYISIWDASLHDFVQFDGVRQC